MLTGSQSRRPLLIIGRMRSFIQQRKRQSYHSWRRNTRQCRWERKGRRNYRRAGRINIGPSLESDVVFIEDATNNAAVRRHDMIASNTRSWKTPIINAEQFYHHKSLRPPSSKDNVILTGIFEGVVKVLVTRRNINEFKKGSGNVYIRLLVTPRVNLIWKEIRNDVRAETYRLYAAHRQSHLQKVFLPEVMQKFAGGDIMT